MEDGRKKVLIVDDEPGVRDSLRLLLKNQYEVEVAEDGSQALSVLGAFHPDLILLDLIMPRIDGMETLRQVRERSPKTPVVILSASNTVKTAVQAMKCGAVDYLNKPFEIDELKTLLLDLLQKDATGSIAGGPTEKNESAIPLIEADFGPMVGRSSSMRQLFSRIQQVAERETTVLITGESGTGKELVARMIHSSSARSKAPFVAINCGAIPETLIESELFGHEKGAFTNAIERRIGHCELANGGTLFLDEIGELTLSVQVKLLRFLQEQEFYRVGRSKSIKVDVRIVAATNRNLEQAIREKRFREDLYYRINVIGLEIPPLRDRFEDIPLLIENFCKRFAALYGGRKIRLTPEAEQILVTYPWPGNVRELENVLESLMALCPNDEIGADDLPDKLRSKGAFTQLATENLSGQLGFDEAERRFESEIILKALKKTNYVQTRAAELLGISRRILKYKMDKLGISGEPEGQTPAAAPQAE
jgi:DNA-binding NtrC family response regulator